MENNSSFESFELQLTNESKDYLSTAAKWCTFLAIVGFIFLGLGVLGSLISIAGGNSYGSAMGGNPAVGMMSGTLAGVFSLIIIILAFIPTLYLYKFASKTKQALANNDTNDLTESMKNLKSYFKFMGILTIIVIILYIVIIIGVIAFAASAAAGM